ncbi:N-acetylmuramic acid 6-phosphate etherase [Arthrobacter gandavensis]|uniref:N-acetylmuramic acid 6-phosphate etherase n=1 Tax=Arthrobacter gandavensis TaxID=169960 RepID=UPI002B26AB6B|nr:N-acetylmuramic acid 6-phosphate etherase [Arthrobacter gandavensis]
MDDQTQPGERAHLREFLGTLPTEMVGERYPDLDLLTDTEFVHAMIESERAVADAVAAQADRITAALNGIVAGMARGGRLIYIGAGTAGRLGILDASEAPPTFGIGEDVIVGRIAGGPGAIHTAVENAEDDSSAGARDVDALDVGPDDALVGISASGRTPYVVGALQRARERGAFTVAHACNPNSAIAAAAHVGIETEVGPELLTGSTRLKAGSAQKLVLNTLSTGAMIRAGKVYRNLMVDLRATNEKLRARSERTVMLATGAGPEAAAAALRSSGGWVKAAILSLEAGIPAHAAVAALEANGGFLRPAIAEARAA